MSALLKMDMYQAVCEAAALKKSTVWVPEVIITADLPAAVEEQRMSTLKSVTLFLASPFIGLAYITAMPFVAAAMIIWFGVKALVTKIPASVKKVGMIIAAPFLGLGFIIALPVVGVTALGYFAMKSREHV
jgi:hypothetical protein